MARCWWTRWSSAVGNPDAPARGGKMWAWQSTIAKSVMDTSAAVPGIEPVSEPVSEDVEGENQERDGDAGCDDKVGRDLDELAASGQHRPPLGSRGSNAEAEKTKRSSEQNRLAGQEAGLDDERRGGVRQDVASEYARIAQPGGHGGLDELLMADLEHATPDQTSQGRYEAARRGGDQPDHPGAGHAGDGDGEDEARNGQQEVREPHEHRIDAPVRIARDQAQGRTEERGQRHGHDGRREREARSHDDA